MASHGGGFAGHSGGGHAFSGAHSGSGFAAHPAARGFASRPSFSSRGFNRARGVRSGGVRSGGVRLRTRWLQEQPLRIRLWLSVVVWRVLRSVLVVGFWFDVRPGAAISDWLGERDEPAEPRRAEEREQGDQDIYARSAPPPPREQGSARKPLPATVLVFRDQHKQEVQNYAIVGQTLWNFAPQHTQKIPLADLDLPATTKANDERGVDFRLPGAREGQ